MPDHHDELLWCLSCPPCRARLVREILRHLPGGRTLRVGVGTILLFLALYAAAIGLQFVEPKPKPTIDRQENPWMTVPPPESGDDKPQENGPESSH